MVTWLGWLAGVLDVFVLLFSWVSSCQNGLWLDRKACQQGRQGGSGKWGTRSLASLGLPRAGLPSAVFLFSLLASAVPHSLLRLQAWAGRSWVRSRLEHWWGLSSSEPRPHGGCVWYYHFLGLWGFVKFKLGLFSAFSTVCQVICHSTSAF